MAEKKFYKVDEDLNVWSKKILHEWLLKAIHEKDKDLFRHCLEVLGKSWNVKRSVPKRVFAEFIEHLWNKRSDILEGNYKWDEESFSFKSVLITKHALSYESKVCFAIAPTKYKIIYDKNTRNNLKILLDYDKDITPQTFETAVNEWLSKNNIDTASEDALYRADYALWSGEAVERQQNQH